MALCGLISACEKPRDADLLASYNGGEVRAANLDGLLRSLPAARRQPAPGQALEEWLQERIVDLVMPEILLARARSAAWSETPALTLRARYLASQEAGRQHLDSACPEQEVSEEDLRRLFEQTVPQEPRPWILLRHVYKRSDRSAHGRQAIRQEMDALRDEIESGASFVELARQHSDSATAAEGGLIGRVSRQSRMERKVLDAAWSLADGGLSSIVEVTNGFHLLYRESSGIEAVADFASTRDGLAKQEALRRREQCGREILGRLGEDTPVRIEATILEPESPDTPVLWIGEESFNSAQLRGLSDEGSPLALSPRPRDAVRHLAESLLLAKAFVEEDAIQENAAPQNPSRANQLSELRDSILRRLLIDAQWVEERKRQVIAQGEDALLESFEQQPERFYTDLELDLGMILLRAEEPGRRRATFEKAEDLRQRLESGEDFERLARLTSQHHSAENGGRLGSLPLPRLGVVLGSKGVAGATALSVGEVSSPLMIQEAPLSTIALLKVFGRSEPKARSFDAARQDLIDTLAKDRVRQLDVEVRARILQEVDLKIWPKAVAAYVATSGAATSDAATSGAAIDTGDGVDSVDAGRKGS